MILFHFCYPIYILLLGRSLQDLSSPQSAVRGPQYLFLHWAVIPLHWKMIFLCRNYFAVGKLILP